MQVVVALAGEVEICGLLLDSLTDDEWAAATRCAPMNVKELAVHAWRGSQRVIEMIEAGPVDAEPEKDGATYFLYDPAAEGAQIVSRAQAVAAEFASPQAVAHAWREGWGRALHLSREVIQRGDPVLRSPFGTLRLSEYLRTRVVEVTVHHMDIRDALLREPASDPSAVETTGDVLRTLLGTDLRPRGMDDERFALVGTGRAPLSEEEREFLGPLADRFPLLA